MYGSLSFFRPTWLTVRSRLITSGTPPADAASRARESENPPSKLLEQQHEERLEPGTARAHERQSELVKRWRPWTKSTGPRTVDGKVRVGRDPCEGGVRQQLRMLARSLWVLCWWVGFVCVVSVS